MPTRRSVWSLLPSRRGRNPTATKLYGRLVAQARAEPFYAILEVPDTPEGRLEMIMLHLVLVQEPLIAGGEAGAVLARDLSETFVADLDDCLREMAVSDLAVPRKVKKAAAALFERTRDYGAALAGQDAGALAGLIEQHVLMVAQGEGASDHSSSDNPSHSRSGPSQTAASASTASPSASRIAAYAMEARGRLGAIDAAGLAGGALPWPDPLAF
jgi:cytochrome b pre-mRNA-processing protein 3